MIYLIEVDAHDGVTLQTLYFATEGITTRPTDTPANAYYEPRVEDPGNFGRSLFSEGTTRGQSSVGAGDIVLVNGDPGNGLTLDDLIGYGFDGRRLVIKTIPDSLTPIAGARTLFVGTCEQLVSSSVLDKLSLRIHDRLLDLDKPLLSVRYAGTTVTGNSATAEGNADLKDQLKPRLFGRCSNVTAVPVNIYDLFFQVNNGPVASIAVFDGGVPLSPTSDYASLDALLAATMVPGQYGTCLALGVFRLGGSAFFTVTADVIEGATAADRTVAQIARRMLLLGGIAEADLPISSFSGLDAKNSDEVGVYLTTEGTILQSVTGVLDSVGGWLVSNRAGQFEVGRFEAPSGPAVVTIDETLMLETPGLERLAAGESGRGIPVWRVIVRYSKVWTVQDDSQLGGTADDGTGPVSAERRSFVKVEYRQVAAENAAVKVKHLLAQEITVDTMLTDATAAQNEANRLLALYSVRRDRYRVAGNLDDLEVAELGTAVELRVNRMGLDAGQLFTVLGRVDEYAEHSVTLDIWG